jgi:hypothetical protein
MYNIKDENERKNEEMYLRKLLAVPELFPMSELGLKWAYTA